MIFYIIRRLLAAVVLAVIVTFITYLLLSTTFVAVARELLGTNPTPAGTAAMMHKLGYDRPVIVQYGGWLLAAAHGDFGTSLFTSEPVSTVLAQRMGVTLSVVLVALALTAIISVTLGVAAAVRGGTTDRILQGASLIGLVVPNLLLAIVLALVFAVKLHWLPATGFTAFSQSPGLWLRSIIMPVIALLVGGVANMAAQVRGAMIDELRKDYVRTLRTRGLPISRIVLRHALRNAASPALTVLGFEFLGMFGSALFIEKVFALPGFGVFAFNSSLQGDIPVIMGISFFGVFLVVGVNLLIDLVNGWLIPKARLT